VNEFARELLTICRAFGMFEREAVCCGTVSVPQCVALQALLEGERDVSGLAEMLGVTAGAATRLVDGLERRGFVARRRTDEDRRRVVVSLSGAGEAEAARLRDMTARALGAVLERVPEDKRALVVEAVGLVSAAVLSARGDISGCCG